MLTALLALLGIVCIAYGLCIFAVASGTPFFVVWLCLGAAFLVAAAGAHAGLFAKLPSAAKCAGGIVLALVLAVGVVETGLIATSFCAVGKPGLDYLIVLGAQVKPDGPSVVLQQRLDTAAAYLRDNPDTLCIVTGGKGTSEPTTEAEGMRDYLLQAGIDDARIICEPQARNTSQNIAFSKELIGDDDASVGIVTNNFHVFRGVAIAKKQGLDNACGLAAPSAPLYLPNNVLRECFGITKDFLVGNM